MQSTQPTDWHHIWLCVKSFIEVLYFLSGVGIAVAAWKALDQLRLAKDQLTTTKDIAKATALREAVKLASDQLKFFADTVLPAQSAAVAKYHEHQCTFLAADPVQPGNNSNNPILSPSQLGYSGGFSGLFGGSKTETAPFKGEPTRESLTQPPGGYQTPSPNFAYGTGPKESLNKEYNPAAGKYGE